ncbi:MAG: hypothetical protein M3Y72_13925 [Acidobacteriota bacterium]|nr:hypothetical protein [Acidobacteriota bacterium]
MLCSRSEQWVKERIEAIRFCLEKQVRIDLPRRILLASVRLGWAINYAPFLASLLSPWLPTDAGQNHFCALRENFRALEGEALLLAGLLAHGVARDTH